MLLLTKRLAVSLARRSWRAYGYVNTAIPVTLGDQCFQVPIVNRMGLTNLAFKPDEHLFLRLLKRLLRTRPGIVVDVGANIGRFLMLVAAADRTRRYVGFEPSVNGCAYIQRLIDLNALAHHSIVAAALADRSGFIHLNFNSATDVCATTTEDFYGASHFRRKAVVPCLQGDALSSIAADPVALLKVDVEGGELEVLEGLSDTVERWRPHLILEIIPPHAANASPETAARRRARLEKLATLLGQWEYTAYRIVEGDRLRLRVDGLDPGASTDTSDMDHLFITKAGSPDLADHLI